MSDSQSDTPPYTPEQALAISMMDTGLRQEAAVHRAKEMIARLLQMGYELRQVRLF